MNVTHRTSVVLLAMALLTHVSWGQTPTVAVSPATQTVHTSDVFTVDVTVSSVTNLHAAHILLAFDRTILQYNQCALGSFLAGAFMPTPNVTHGPSMDTIMVDQATLGTATANGSGTLLTFQFAALTVGSSTLALNHVDLRSGTNSIIPSLSTDGQVTVGLPLPISLASFAVTLTTGNRVFLKWKTVSETANYGFFVQRRNSGGSAFEDLPGSFVQGQGTTVTPHDYSYVDATAGAGKWEYRLKQVDLGGVVNFSETVELTVASATGGGNTPLRFGIEQNFPNPFNPMTTIRYTLAASVHVELVVLNVLGQKVGTLVDEIQPAGSYDVRWTEASGVSSGIYYYSIHAGTYAATNRMVLLR